MEHLREIPFRPTGKSERNRGRLLLIGIMFIMLGSLFLTKECSTNKEPVFGIEEIQR